MIDLTRMTSKWASDSCQWAPNPVFFHRQHPQSRILFMRHWVKVARDPACALWSATRLPRSLRAYAEHAWLTLCTSSVAVALRMHSR